MRYYPFDKRNSFSVSNHFVVKLCGISDTMYKSSIRLSKFRRSFTQELEQKLLKSWLHLVHERNTLVRKQDDLNSLQNEEDLEERCCVVLKEMRKYQNMRGRFGCPAVRG